MTRHPNLKIVSFFFSIFFLLSSCGNDDTTTTNTNTAVTTDTAVSTDAPTATAIPVVKAAALTGRLDTLWGDAAVFKNLPNGRKLVFSFTFRNPDTLTLYGWPCQNNNCTSQYATDPAIKLIKGKPTAYDYGPKVIFGNVIIDKRDVAKIKTKIGTVYNSVAFAPENDGEYVKYKVFVSIDSVESLVARKFAVEPTGIEANPSPPKN